MRPSRALVMGSGFGGLAAAVRLRAKGYQVEVHEAMGQPGGRAAVFHDKGFVYDAGPTVITAPYLFDELFECLGEKRQDYFELLPIDPFYRISFDDGTIFDYVGDEERLLAQIERFNPRDVDGYKRLADHARRIFEVGYTQLADHPFEYLSDMFRVAPDMIKLQNYRTVYGLVSKYIKDPRLRQAFSFEPLLVGGNPFKTTSIYLLIHWLERKWGVHFAKGGTNQIVHSLVQLLKKHGVEFHFNSPIQKIEVEQGQVVGVRSKKGEFIPCDLVVSNADPINVYGNMVDKKYRKVNSNTSLMRKQSSMSLFVMYFGTKKLYPNLCHHTILLGPRYRGLLKDIFDRKVLSEDFSLYLHAPTRTDRTLAPPGHECFYVLSPVPNNLSDVNWRETGPVYAQKILDWLEDNALPGLNENLVSQFHITPDYFEKKLHSHLGSGFGIEPIFRQSAYFRFHNRSEDVKNLYFVGANTHPGAGVPGVLNSARVLEKMVPDATRPFQWRQREFEPQISLDLNTRPPMPELR